MGSSGINGGERTTSTTNSGLSLDSQDTDSTLNINTGPKYITTTSTTDGDCSAYITKFDEMNTQILNWSIKYSSLEVQYQKVQTDYLSLKTEFTSGKDKECDCDKKLKNCELNLIKKDNDITTYKNTIIELETKLKICLTNCAVTPLKTGCEDIKMKLKIEIEKNEKCLKEKNEITQKWTFSKTEITNITIKYDALLIKYDLLVKSSAECTSNITIFEKKIVTINKTCETTINNLTIKITKLEIAININKNCKKCKEDSKNLCPCKTEPNPADLTIKHQLDQC